MRLRTHGRLSLTLIMLLLATGCTGGGQEDARQDAAADPIRGGTLRVVNDAPIEHFDNGFAYSLDAWTMARLYLRTLYSWKSGVPAEQANDPVPDIAAGPPTISEDRLTYTFKLRPDVRYAPPVNRAVKAEDFIYAVERQLDPKLTSGNPYNTVIKGVQEFVQGKAKTISGMKAMDDTTLQITLAQPASDFLSIIALPFYAPVPAEHASKYQPQIEYSKNLRNAGPYFIEKWTPSKSFTLRRNPNWNPVTDPLRKAYVDRIEVREGVPPDAALQETETRNSDVPNSPPPVADRQRLANDPDLSKRFITPLNGCIRYLTLQTDNGPTAKLQVRQAINYAVDKEAIVRALGGRLAAEPATTILPPTLAGYQKYDLYPSPGNRGDPVKAKQLLAQAGYPDGVTVTMVSDSSGDGPAILTSLSESLGKAGIKIKNKAYGYPAILSESLQLPSKAAEHQIGQGGFCPDYPGNGARTLIGVLLDGRKITPQFNNNFGNYNSPKTNRLIDQAIAAPTKDTAAAIWAETDKQAMQDAAWVPLTYDKRGIFWSDRVKGAEFSSWVAGLDLANLWLDPNKP